MNNLWQAFRISFSLKNTYRVNSIIYSLKQIPLIKKLLPASLYQNRGLKIFANIIAIIWEILSTFLGKALYVFTMVFGPVLLFAHLPSNSLFIHVLFFLTLAGAYTNTYLFNPTKDKYYAIFLLNMNAKTYGIANYIYQMVKLVVGFLPFTIIAGNLAGVPLGVSLLCPVFIAAAKLIYAAFQLKRYEKTGDPTNENALKKAGWIGVGVLFAAAYGLPAISIVLPLWLAVAMGLAFILLGLCSLRVIVTFKDYRPMYQLILAQNAQVLENAKQNTAKSARGYISQDGGITSSRKGFEYFNELFIKRHRKILWGPVKKITLVSLGVIALVILVIMINPSVKGKANEILLSFLPYSLLLMYGINRGTSFTLALFMNCDHSMLTYPFYKKPRDILRLFAIRLREIVKVNLLPAGVIGIGISIILYVSRGGADSSYYYIIPISFLAMSVFFSVHYLVLYYLLQPYNAGTEMKSSLYSIVVAATYGVVYGLSSSRFTYTPLIGLIIIGFCLLYCLVACIGVYYLAPKTFKLRN